MTVLETVADRQAKWSAKADALKATIDQARRSVFVLSILGALAAALASQMVPGADGQSPGSNPRTWVAIVGVICLAASTFFSARLLGGEHVAAWVRARATARRLENRRNRSQEPWSDFVNDCESILATENTSWIAKWTKMNQVAK